jgi:hypothetical protein
MDQVFDVEFASLGTKRRNLEHQSRKRVEMATGQPIDDLSDLSIAELVSLKGKTALIT